MIEDILQPLPKEVEEELDKILDKEDIDFSRIEYISIALLDFDIRTSFAPPTSVNTLFAILLKLITSAFTDAFVFISSNSFFSAEYENCSGVIMYIFSLFFILFFISLKQNSLFPVPAVP